MHCGVVPSRLKRMGGQVGHKQTQNKNYTSKGFLRNPILSTTLNKDKMNIEAEREKYTHAFGLMYATT